MKSIILLLLCFLCSVQTAFADSIDDYYKPALEKIKADLEAKGVHVKKIELEGRTQALGTSGPMVTAWMAIEIDGMTRKIMLPMVLSLNNVVFDHKSWIDIFSLRWNTQLLNIGLGLPSEFIAVEAILKNLARETAGLIEHLEKVEVYAQKNMFNRGDYLKQMIAAVEDKLRAKLALKNNVEYVDQKGVAQNKLIFVTDSFVPDIKYLKERLELLNEVLKYQDKTLALMEDRNLLKVDITPDASREKKAEYERAKAELLHKNAQVLQIKNSIIILLDLHARLNSALGQESIIMAEDRLLADQLKALKELQKSLELTAKIKTVTTAEAIGPYTKPVSYYRQAILLCQRNLDRLAGLGLELGTRNMIIEVNAEILEAQEKIKAFKYLDAALRTDAHIADIYNITEGIAQKVSRAHSLLELEYSRLQELKLKDKLQSHHEMRLSKIELELEILSAQMKQAHKLTGQGRFILKGR